MKEYSDNDVKELIKVTKEEKSAITRFKSAATSLSKHHFWIFCDGTGLYIMRKGDEQRGKGHRVMTGFGGGVDDRFIVDKAMIDCDGGDW